MLPRLETGRLFMREVRIEDGPALQAFQSRKSQWWTEAKGAILESDWR